MEYENSGPQKLLTIYHVCAPDFDSVDTCRLEVKRRKYSIYIGTNLIWYNHTRPFLLFQYRFSTLNGALDSDSLIGRNTSAGVSLENLIGD